MASRYACRFLPLHSSLVMQTKSFLELADIKAIAAAAEAEALKHNWAVSIAIVDDGGHLLWLQRLDGASPISAHIAPAKANTAALGRRESKVYEDMVNGGRVVPERPRPARAAGGRRADPEGRAVPGSRRRERSEIDRGCADCAGGHRRHRPLRSRRPQWAPKKSLANRARPAGWPKATAEV